MFGGCSSAFCTASGISRRAGAAGDFPISEAKNPEKVEAPQAPQADARLTKQPSCCVESNGLGSVLPGPRGQSQYGGTAQ